MRDLQPTEKTPKQASVMSVRRNGPSTARTQHSVNMFRSHKKDNKGVELAKMSDCLQIGLPFFESELDRLYREYWGRTLEDYESMDYEGVQLYSENTVKAKFDRKPLSFNQNNMKNLSRKEKNELLANEAFKKAHQQLRKVIEKHKNNCILSVLKQELKDCEDQN